MKRSRIAGWRCHARRLLSALLLVTAVAAQGAGPDRITLPQARFATGDDPERAQPDFDDSGWKLLNTTQNYEVQGFAGYDGYAWYRIHVVIPSSLKASSDWPQRLRVQLAAIDDVDETYLNGVRIGKTGRMPGDPGGYDGRWETIRDYGVNLGTGIVRWDRDNVIAVRVYDAGGGGGFHKGMPYLQLAQRTEGLDLSPGQWRHRFLPGSRVKITLNVANRFPVHQRGQLRAEFVDTTGAGVVLRRRQPLVIAPEGVTDVSWTLPARPGLRATIRFVDGTSGRSVTAVQDVPYRLTPPDAPTPAIHGARLLGARPGAPLHHRVPATGRAPLRYAAQGLPAGLAIDAETGVISGTVPPAGSYKLQLRVSNALGSATKAWTLVAGDQLALTPPMGWNSWNAYGLSISDERVRQAAQAFIDKGLAAKGWNSINIDDGWEAVQRRPDGEIEGNERFPDMAALGRFLHERGLGFGIYSSPGPTTCGGYLGSLGHEAQDAATYARWGVDYLKYDLCSYAQILSKPPVQEEHQRPYLLMGQALKAQNRGIVYSLCQYGQQRVWTWGAAVGGHAWRMTGDIVDTWPSVLETGFAMAPYAAFTGPGRWNDPDMLVVGRVGWGDPRPSSLTPEEQYSHISLWSLLAAPLLLGNELSSLDEFTLGLVTNSEVIAINQDALGRSARLVLDRDGWQVWVKELEGGAKAVGVFNLGEKFRRLSINPALFGRGVRERYEMRDAWRQRKLGARTGAFPVSVPAHGVVLLTTR